MDNIFFECFGRGDHNIIFLIMSCDSFNTVMYLAILCFCV